MQDLSFLPGIDYVPTSSGSLESETLDHQGSPKLTATHKEKQHYYFVKNFL